MIAPVLIALSWQSFT